MLNEFCAFLPNKGISSTIIHCRWPKFCPTQVEWGPPEMRGRTEDLLEGGEEGEDPRDAAGPASRSVREAQWGYGAG